MEAADFSGYATKAGLKCSDGRTIKQDAFAHQDGMKVPLVWQHGHLEPANVLGHAVLENRPDGVYAYAYFNSTEPALHAKVGVQHGDIVALSIYANQLVEKSKTVLHGAIREVSLVLSGANPGALIDNVSIAHGDGDVETLEDTAIIYTGLALEHEDKSEGNNSDDGSDEETVQEVYDTLTDKQKDVVHFMLGEAAKGDGTAEHSSDNSDDSNSDDQSTDNTSDDANNEDNLAHQEGTETMTNVFEQNGGNATGAPRPTLTHSQLKTIVEDASKLGSFKESFLAHAVEYGIENIDFLFPDARAIDNAPELISRRVEWVSKVVGGAKKSPFSRIKTLSADLTLDTARAKGYVKATLKKEEWFALAKRITTPTTIYKKQKLDRDDIIDITDLDVVAWLKGEMRLMLDEEIARAVLVGDGREVDDEDKVNETMIRPIAYDDDFYTHKVVIPSNVVGDAVVEAILRARPFYKGSGNPTLFITESLLTDLLLVKDKMGRRLYPTQGELESALRVKEIVTVEIMESLEAGGGDLVAVMVNMSDYTMGADKGGNVSMFDDFDIDYNQYKYLIEGRMSGALTKFKSAIAFSRGAGTLVVPEVPTFVNATGVLTVPNEAGVVYKNADTGVVLAAGAQAAIAAGASIEVEAVPDNGYYFANNTDTDWEFTRDA